MEIYESFIEVYTFFTDYNSYLFGTVKVIRWVFSSAHVIVDAFFAR